MSSSSHEGYRNAGLALLQAQGVRVWSRVRARTRRGSFEGLVLPRSETADDRHIVLKLDQGYNVGLAVETIESLEELGYHPATYHIPEQEFPADPSKPRVQLLGTGGTIASRLDYRTGAVIPAFSPGELYASVPELAEVCNLSTEKLFAVFSENMGPEQYVALAQRIGVAIEEGYDGVVIGHGTDTMHHTAAALSYMVQDTPIPVVLVGSQRSSDRPSSDAALNLINATRAAAHSDIAEVMVCMFGPTSDQYDLLHQGTRVRKMHSSYRSTFRTLSDVPLAVVGRDAIHPIRTDYSRRDPQRKPRIQACYDDRVSLLYYYPGMKPDIVSALMDNGYRGIVIAGTGLGHVNKPLYPVLAEAARRGIHVFMTVQTLWGFAQMYVYETGRELMDLGVLPLGNMLPEVAFIKLGWVLGQTDDPATVRRLMQTPVSRDITEREPHNGYIVLQGGLPEVDQFLSRVLR